MTLCRCEFCIACRKMEIKNWPYRSVEIFSKMTVSNVVEAAAAATAAAFLTATAFLTTSAFLTTPAWALLIAPDRRFGLGAARARPETARGGGACAGWRPRRVGCLEVARTQGHTLPASPRHASKLSARP